MAESPNSEIMDRIFDSKYTEDSEGQSTANTNTTPNSELSPPDSPKTENAGLSSINARANSRSLAASLSLEEQVGALKVQFDLGVLTIGRFHFWLEQISGDRKLFPKRVFQPSKQVTAQMALVEQYLKLGLRYMNDTCQVGNLRKLTWA
jgi:hypothetical protein